MARAAEPADGIEPAPRSSNPRLPEDALRVKFIRPGISGVAGVPPVGGCLIVEGFSREANAAGVETTGMTGFFECSVTKHIVLSGGADPLPVQSGTSGFGDIAFGPKVTFNHETAYVPLFALGYSYKQPTATHHLGSGLSDHKVTALRRQERLPHDSRDRQLLDQVGRLPRRPTSGSTWSPSRLRPPSTAKSAALQTYYASSVLDNYGGAVAAAVYSFRPTFATKSALEHGFGPKSADFGVILGFNYLYRPRPR